jgi:hypothetical protein
VLVFALGCHDPNQIRSLEARAVLNTTSLDFGGVGVGLWKELGVKIQNVGYVPFAALDVLKLDGNPSFEAEIVNPAQLIQPGESRTVKVRFHPLQEGPVHERIQVDVDAEHSPRTPVSLKGVGTPTPIQVSPPLVDFQTLEIQSDRVLSFTVTNPADLPLSIAITGSSKALFSADRLAIPPRGKVQVHARYAPQAEGNDLASYELRSCDSCTPTRLHAIGRAVKSAFSFAPAPVPFDLIPVHEKTRSRMTMTNITWRPVRISNTVASDESFTPLTGLAGRSVGPGESVAVELQFAARTSGPTGGTLYVHYVSDRPRMSQVELDATGGRPRLAIDPVKIDFGTVLIGSKHAAVVRLSNAGTGGDLRFIGVRNGGQDPGQFKVSAPFRGKQVHPWDPATAWPDVRQPLPGLPIAPADDSVDIKVFYEPTVEGDAKATLTFLSDDMFSPERQIFVMGRGKSTPPCTYRVLPSVLDFGHEPVGQGAVLGFNFENTGPTTCTVKDIGLTDTGGGAFFMDGDGIAGGEIPSQSGFAAAIAFRPMAPGSYEGELSITVNDPVQPVFRLPLRGSSMANCLVAMPPYFAFGAIRFDCSPRPLTTYVLNICPAPVTVTRAWIGPGTSDQYSIAQAPPFPLELQPGQGFELGATYSRTRLGQHFSPLYIQESGAPIPLMVPLVAETNHEGLFTDQFIQGTDSQLDVLFVVSNTTTMQRFQDRLAASLPGFMAKARDVGLDLHAGVTTTGLVPRSSACPGGAEGGEAGRLFPVDGSRQRIVGGTDSASAAVLDANLRAGICHNLVQGLETMRSALSPPIVDRVDDPFTPQPNDGNLGFARDTARLAVVFLSDEDDHSGFDPDSYTRFLETFKGSGMSQRTTAYAIVPTDASSCTTAGAPGPRFSSVATATGGEVLNVCASRYDGLLDSLAAKAAGLQTEFRLTQPAEGTADMTVAVDGAAAGGWTYDPARNAVDFTGAAVPRPGQVVTVHYRASCPAP